MAELTPTQVFEKNQEQATKEFAKTKKWFASENKKSLEKMQMDTKVELRIAQTKGKTEDFKNLSKIMSDIVDDISKADTRATGKLEKDKLSDIADVIRNNNTLLKEEKDLLEQQVKSSQKLVSFEMDNRLSAVSSMGKVLTDKMPDMMGMISGIMGDNPLLMAAGGMIGDFMRGRKEQAAEAKKSKTEYLQERQLDSADAMVEHQQELIEIQKKASNDKELEIQRNAEENREKIDREEELVEAVKSIDITAGPVEEKSGLFGALANLAEFIGGIVIFLGQGSALFAKLFPNLATLITQTFKNLLIAPLRTISTLFKSIALPLAKFVGKWAKALAGFQMLFEGIIGMTKGNQIAAKIFGKAEKDLTETEKTAGQIGGFFGGVTKIIDMLAGWFGLDGYIHKLFGGPINEFVTKNLTIGIVDMFTTTKDEWIMMFKLFISDIGTALGNILNVPSEMINSLLNWVENTFKIEMPELPSLTDALTRTWELGKKMLSDLFGVEFVRDFVGAIINMIPFEPLRNWLAEKSGLPTDGKTMKDLSIETGEAIMEPVGKVLGSVADLADKGFKKVTGFFGKDETEIVPQRETKQLREAAEATEAVVNLQKEVKNAELKRKAESISSSVISNNSSVSVKNNTSVFTHTRPRTNDDTTRNTQNGLVAQ